MAAQISSISLGALGVVALVGITSGCGGGEASPTPVDLGTPIEELILPDLTGLDMESSLRSALELALAADLRRPWAAHAQSLDLRQTGCPDIYVGDLSDIDLDDLEGGIAWMDRCRTHGGLGYSGLLGWTSFVNTQGDAEEASGQTTLAERALQGDGFIDDPEGALFEFDGDGQDAYYANIAPGYERWSYSSQVDATVTGRLVFGGTAWAGGWRQQLYVRYERGPEESLEVRGNIYLLDETFDRFDSIAADFTLQGEVGASPEECTLEPSGYIGLRDPSAYWYEVIFQPRYSGGESDGDYENPRSGCEGCGTLYIRGVEQGEICVDFSWIWPQLSGPDIDDYVVPVR